MQILHVNELESRITLKLGINQQVYYQDGYVCLSIETSVINNEEGSDFIVAYRKTIKCMLVWIPSVFANS